MDIPLLLHKSIRDKNGRIVIWQRPNLPVISWFLCVVAAHVFHSAPLHTGFSSLGSAFLFAWAYLEIVQGASYFRRFLGFVVVVAITMHYF